MNEPANTAKLTITHSGVSGHPIPTAPLPTLLFPVIRYKETTQVKLGMLSRTCGVKLLQKLRITAKPLAKLMGLTHISLTLNSPKPAWVLTSVILLLRAHPKRKKKKISAWKRHVSLPAKAKPGVYQ